MPSLEWRDRAACADTPKHLFFPAPGESLKPAKAICATCPVRAECLDYALSQPEMRGVWGGTSERQRRGMNPRPVTWTDPFIVCTDCGRTVDRTGRNQKRCKPCGNAWFLAYKNEWNRQQRASA